MSRLAVSGAVPRGQSPKTRRGGEDASQKARRREVHFIFFFSIKNILFTKHEPTTLHFFFYRQAFKLRQTEEQRKQVEIRRQREEEMLQKRQQYVEKTKNALVFGDMPSEKTSKKGKKGRSDQYVSDSGASGGEEGRAGDSAPRERKRKRKASGEGKEKRRGKGRRKNSGESGGKNSKTFLLRFINHT